MNLEIGYDNTILDVLAVLVIGCYININLGFINGFEFAPEKRLHDSGSVIANSFNFTGDRTNILIYDT